MDCSSVIERPLALTRGVCVSLPFVAKISQAHPLILTGREAILCHASVLEAFACACNQPAAMHALRFTLDHPYARRKTPRLICLLARPDEGEQISVETLLGCVLFFEHRIGRRHTGLVATGDSSGLRSLIGPAHLRAEIAARGAAIALSSAHIVLASFRQPGSASSSFPSPPGPGFWTASTRALQDHLPLECTYEATLAALGRRTRNHLRYYRRRATKELGCEFFPDATPYIPSEQVAHLNTSSLDPVDPSTFDLQYRMVAEHRDGFVCGLRARDGRWLSLAGGWRQGDTTVLQWQSNAAGFEKYSLGTAFRAFLLEHEVLRGTMRLGFHNGTSHSMNHAFLREEVVDLVLRRRSIAAWLATRLLPVLASGDRLMAVRGNLLADALRTPDIHWRPCAESIQ